MHLPLRAILQRGSTDIVSRITQDTQSLSGGFNALLSRAVAQVTKGFAGLVAAFIIDWRLAFIAVLVGPILFLIIRKLGKRIRRAARAVARRAIAS